MAAHNRDHLKLVSGDLHGEAIVALQHIQALLDAIYAVTQEGLEQYVTDPVLSLTMLAKDQCFLVEQCLNQMLDEDELAQQARKERKET